LALVVADALALFMIELARAGSAQHTAKNGCVSSVRQIGCGRGSAIWRKELLEKSYSAVRALA